MRPKTLDNPTPWRNPVGEAPGPEIYQNNKKEKNRLKIKVKDAVTKKYFVTDSKGNVVARMAVGGGAKHK